MNYKIIFIIFIIILHFEINAASIRLVWDLNPPIEDVTKYIIYQAKNSEPFVVIREVTGSINEIAIENLTIATYEYKIIAQNRFGKSRPSASVFVKIIL